MISFLVCLRIQLDVNTIHGHDHKIYELFGDLWSCNDLEYFHERAPVKHTVRYPGHNTYFRWTHIINEIFHGSWVCEEENICLDYVLCPQIPERYFGNIVISCLQYPILYVCAQTLLTLSILVNIKNQVSQQKYIVLFFNDYFFVRTSIDKIIARIMYQKNSKSKMMYITVCKLSKHTSH